MRILFFGSSVFAVPTLERLFASTHTMLGVVSQPDRPRGRHLHPEPTPVSLFARSKGVAVLTPANCNDPCFIASLKQLSPELCIVVAYGQLLSQGLLDVPSLFSVNIHASLLPKYRGAAPVNWALIQGESVSGVTIFKINAHLDRGDVIAQEQVAISLEDTALTLAQRLAQCGADCMMRVLDSLVQKTYVLTPQPQGRFVGAPKLKKTDGFIDWQADAVSIERRIRGLVPWPSAYTFFQGKILKILDAEILMGAENATEGQAGIVQAIIKPKGFVVQCGKNCLLVTRVKPEGSRVMDAYHFAIGHALKPGSVLV